jgi:toxin ParE1/3/4
MSVFKLTAQAEEDLIEIWTYIAQDNPDAADRLLERISGKLPLLAEQPALGPSREDIAQELRYLPVGNYLILYRIIADGIEVVRIVQGMRSLKNMV